LHTHPEKRTIALFNYGGGMRGLIPAHLMTRMEDMTGLRMAEMVDIFTGPSTGSILNAAMTLRHPDEPSQPKYRARHMVRFYEREGAEIFPADSFREFRGLMRDLNNRTLKFNKFDSILKHGHYDPGNLAAALRALLGDAYLKDSLRSLIIPTYNIDGQIRASEDRVIDNGGRAVWLKNIRTGYPETAAQDTPNVRLYDAVMASCAAPTYFPCHHFMIQGSQQEENTFVSGIDGCIFDNPCITYMGALRQHVPPDNKLTMIVLGTGNTNKSIKKDDWNRFGALGVVDPANDLPLINIFFNAPESALLDAFAAEMQDNLFVLNKPLLGPADDRTPSAEIDDGSPENLKRMRFFAEDILEENAKTFDDICHIMVDNRDRRSQEYETRKKKARMKSFFTLFSGSDDTERNETR
jgi:patatin-like phospholipase/acyl hydrolase